MLFSTALFQHRPVGYCSINKSIYQTLDSVRPTSKRATLEIVMSQQNTAKTRDKVNRTLKVQFNSMLLRHLPVMVPSPRIGLHLTIERRLQAKFGERVANVPPL